MDTGRAVARSILGDGYGAGLKFDESLVAKSAAFNRVGGVARDVISTGVSSNAITREEADALRKLIKEGNTDAFNQVNTLAGKMNASDSEAAKAVAGRFNETYEGFNKATADGSISSYAEFLGREGKQGLGLKATASGYFLDAQHGNERIKTAAIAGAGVAVAGRVLSGGTLTHKNTGERDIAGVPFI
jgi:hypothetical protein